MAYSTRRFIKHIDDYDRVHRLEIQQLDFAGSATAIKGNKDAGAFQFEHEDVTDENGYLKVYANPIQKGMLEVYPIIEDSTDYALLTDIFQSDEDEFRLVWKIDGSVYWTGYVLNDLLEFEESSYPYTSTIVAKDFSRLKGTDYPLTDIRQTWITTIADLLSYLNLGLDIDTATSWTESHLDSSITGDYDYLNHIYHETKALREFGRTGDEDPQPISVYEALERVLSDNCLILKQIAGKYQIDQLSAYNDPANVLVSTYDSTGTQTAQTTVDKTLAYNRNTMRVKTQGSKSKGFVAIKRAKVKFEHRNKISGILFPEEVEFTDSESQQFEEPFISDGTQTLRITGLVRALMREGATDATASLSISIVRSGQDDYYLNNDYDWVTTGSSLDALELVDMGGDVWQSGFDILTGETPADADGLLRISISSALASNTMPQVAHTTFWRDMALEIRNINNSTYSNFQLTQPDGYSEKYEHAKTWFGDGPNSFSVSALRYGSANNEITTESWQRRGTTTGYRYYHENILKEIVDIQRSFVFRKEAAMWGLYDATKVLQYRSGNYYYTGGTFKGASGDWNVRIMDVNVQTGSDDFQEILKYADENVESSTPTSPPSEGGDSGISQSAADGRYFNESELLGEIATADQNAALQNLGITATKTELNRLDGTLATVQANLGLKDGSADLNFNSLQLDNLTDNRILLAGAGGLIEDDNSLTFDGDTLEVSYSDGMAQIRNAGVGTHIRLYDGAEQTFIVRNYLTNGYQANFNLGGIEVEGNSRFIGDGGSMGLSDLSNAYVLVGTASSGVGIDSNEIMSAGSALNLGTVDSNQLRFNTSGNLGALITPDGDFEINGGYLGNRSFNTGFLGNGWRSYQRDSEWHFETDVGFFRSALFANEFIINQILATQGSRISGPGRGKVETVIDSTSGSEVVDVSDPDGNNYAAFAQNDLILCLQVRNDLDIGTTNILTDSGGVIVKRYVRRVTDVTGNQVTFSTPGDAPSDAGSVSQGDVIVAFGNTTDPARQSILYETVIEPQAPYTSLKTNIDSWTAYKSGSNLRMKYGKLDGSYGYGTNDTFGLAVGSPSGDHATFDPTNGVRFIDGSGTIGAQFNSSVLTLGTGSNFLEFDVDAGSGNIELDTFRLETNTMLLTHQADGLLRVGEGGTNNQAGITGSTLGGAVAFWAGANYSNRSTAPVWIQHNGVASFANGILTASLSEVGLASFTADSGALYQTSNGVDISIGDDGGLSWSSSIVGLQMGQDIDNRLWAGEAASGDIEFAVWEGGEFVFQAGTRDNRIAGSYFDADAMWGGDPNMTDGSIILNWASSYISLPKASDGTRGRIDSSGITLPSVSDQALNFKYPASSGVTDASIYTDDADMFIHGHGHLLNVRSITIEPNPSDYGYGLTNIGGMLTLYDKDDSYPTATSGTTSITGISRSRVYLTASGGPTINTMTTEQALKDGMILFITLDRSGSNMYFDYTSTGNIATRNDAPQELLPGGTIFFIYDADINRWSMQQDRN